MSPYIVQNNKIPKNTINKAVEFCLLKLSPICFKEIFSVKSVTMQLQTEQNNISIQTSKVYLIQDIQGSTMNPAKKQGPGVSLKWLEPKIDIDNMRPTMICYLRR